MAINTPKGRPRGRPIKASRIPPAADDRRAQLRHAQNAFRLRKKQATSLLEQRILTLEDCVEQMGNSFLEFTGSVVNSGVLVGSSVLARKLFEATVRFIDLARVAAGEEEEQVEPVLPSREESSLQLRSPSLDTTGNLLTGSCPTPTSLPDLNNPFGNGWFERTPQLRGPPSPNILPVLDTTTLSFKLLRQTLFWGYNALLGTTLTGMASSASIAFRFALLFHSVEELLFNLRWFLGPGSGKLMSLAPVVFGGIGEVAWAGEGLLGCFGPAQVLHPAVDTAALGECQPDYTYPAFCNANGVEEYLRGRGAFYFDQDVFRMDLSALSQGELLPGLLSTPQQAPSVNIFTFNALLPVHDEQASQTIQSYAATNQYFTLSVSAFVDQLSRLGVCLGNGPGYSPKAIDFAILAAVVGEA